MKASRSFKQMLKVQGYSDDSIEQLWKWYDPTEKNGVASY